MLSYIFKAILITSFIGSALTLLMLVLRPITRKFFSVKWHYYMWLVVLLVMIIPFRFTKPIVEQYSKTHTIISPIQEVAHSEILGFDEESSSEQVRVFESLMVFLEEQINLIAIIWISVATLLLSSKILTYILFLIRLKKRTKVISCDELLQFTDKKITTRVGNEFSSPLTFGIFRTTLLLPEVSMTDEHLYNVLFHEMIHFRRKDILYKWLVCVVKCVHWFNPLIYYISEQVDIECEMSCDTEVVKNMSKEQQTRYIDTIITLIAAGNKKPTTITTGMVNDKKTLERRFTMIKKKVKISKKAMTVSVVLSLAVIGGAVFAGGILNGNLIDKSEENKEQNLKEIKTENGSIIYNDDNGEIISAKTRPTLPPNKKEEKKTESKIVADITANNNEEFILEKIDLKTSIENPVKGEIAAVFGKREHPITKEVREHNGVDIKAPEGTDVVSSISGVVTDVGFDSKKGNYIVIENKNIKTLYTHLKTTKVQKGDDIIAKQSIGTVGRTGNATGAHLHFEVMVDGEYCDPESLIN